MLGEEKLGVMALIAQKELKWLNMKINKRNELLLV